MNRRLAGIMAVAGVAAAAGAQDADNAKTEELPALVVTAARRGQETWRIPANVTMLTGEDLAEGKYLTVDDALRDQPGIHVRSITGNPATSEISMRGFGENSHGRVLILLDGRRLNRPDLATINWFQIPLSRVERIEIVRGSATALYGDNALAGVINIITRKGTAEPTGYVSADAGSFGSRAIGGNFSASEGKLSYSANAEWYETDGYRERSGVDSVGAGLNLGYNLSRETEATLSLSRQSVDYEIPGYLTREQMAADPEQSTNPDDDAENEYVNADVGMLSSIGDNQRFEINLSYGRKDIESNVASWSLFSDLVLDTFAVTPRYMIDGNLRGRANSLLLGADYYYDTFELDRYGSRTRDAKSGDAEIDKSTVAVYARNELTLDGNVLLTAAGRLESAMVDAEVTSFGAPTVDDDKTHDGSAFDLALLKYFENKSKLFVRAGTTYRYPFVDEQVSYYGWGDAFYGDIDPEEGWNLEAGGMAHVSHGLSAGLTVFLMQMEDEIAYNPVTMRNENLDETSRMGVETDITLRGEGYTLSANYSLTRAEFTEGANDGKDVPLVPAHKASVIAELELPADLSLRGVATYTGESYLGGDNANDGPKLDDYTVVDLFLRHKCRAIEGLEAYAGVENLFDEEYASLGYRGYPDDGYYPSPGVSYRGGVSYRF